MPQNRDFYIYIYIKIFFSPPILELRLSVLSHLRKFKFHHPVLVHYLTSLELLNFSTFSREGNQQKIRISVDSTTPRFRSEKRIYSCLLIDLCKMSILLSESSISHALLYKPQQCQFTPSLNVLLENGFYMKCIVARPPYISGMILPASASQSMERLSICLYS